MCEVSVCNHERTPGILPSLRRRRVGGGRGKRGGGLFLGEGQDVWQKAKGKFQIHVAKCHFCLSQEAVVP